MGLFYTLKQPLNRKSKNIFVTKKSQIEFWINNFNYKVVVAKEVTFLI
jgi:hypothetical protein